MSRSDTGRQECRRTRQYYRRAAGSQLTVSPNWVCFVVCVVLAHLLSPFALSQTLLNIRVLEGEGVVHAPGAKARAGLVVQVTDETGRPVEGAAVSFRMPEEGPGGTFARGMKTEIATTTPDGRAAAYGIECSSVTGPFQIRVTAVKQQVRAGMIVSQYVSERATSSSGGKKLVASSSKRKWLLIGGIAAGAAVGAVLAMPRGGGASAPANSSGATPQIGLPTIVIGKP